MNPHSTECVHYTPCIQFMHGTTTLTEQLLTCNAMNVPPSPQLHRPMLTHSHTTCQWSHTSKLEAQPKWFCAQKIPANRMLQLQEPACLQHTHALHSACRPLLSSDLHKDNRFQPDMNTPGQHQQHGESCAGRTFIRTTDSNLT